MKEKLDWQRKELELQLGLSAGPTPPTPTASENPIRSVRSSSRGGKASSRGGKNAAKVGNAIQTPKTSGRKRKRSTAVYDPSSSGSDENILQAGNEIMSQEDCSPVGAGSEGGKVARTVDKTRSRDGVEGDLLLENEVDQALEELFNE